MLRFAAEHAVAEATQKKLQALFYDADKRAIALRAELATAQLEQQRALEQDSPDINTVLKQMDKVGQLQTELKKQHVRAMLEAQALLTPEQRALLRKRMHAPGGHGEPR